MSTLPELDFVITCGHCGFDVEVEPETYTCHRCGLYWYVSNGSCHYIEGDDHPACGVATDAPPVVMRDHLFRHAPCQLPEGHETEEHWHPLELVGPAPAENDEG